MATRAQLEQYAKNPNVRKFLDLISYTEGTQGNGYRTAFGGGRLNSLNDHPRYSKSFKQLNGKTNTTSAAGRYQFLKSTWDGVARQYGLRDFSPHSQDLGAIALLIGRGALAPLLKGDWQTAVRKSGREWASLPTAPASYSQPTKSWAKVNQFMTGKASPNGYQPPQGNGSIPMPRRLFQPPPMLDASQVQPQKTFTPPPLIDAPIAQNVKSFEPPPLLDASEIGNYNPNGNQTPIPLYGESIDEQQAVTPTFQPPPLLDLSEIQTVQQPIIQPPDVDEQGWQT